MPGKMMLALILLLLPVGAPGPAAAATRAFALVETADVQRSVDWYSAVFGLRLVNRQSRPTHEHRVLLGPDLLMEIVQMKPPRPAPAERTLRIGKFGVELGDLDAFRAQLLERGIAPSGGLFFDEAVGLASFQLRDPDGNIVQIFGHSRGPFDSVVKVDPSLAR